MREDPVPREEEGGLVQAANWFNFLLERFCHGLLYVGGLIIVVMMFATTYDVFMRYVMREPTGWVFTMSSAAMPILAFLSAPAMIWTRGHIDMDLLHRSISPRLQAVADIVVSLSTLAFSAGLSWLAYQATGSTYMDGLRTSGNFSIPLWPMYASVWIGCLLIAIASVLSALPLRSTDAVDEQEGPPLVY